MIQLDKGERGAGDDVRTKEKSGVVARAENVGVVASYDGWQLVEIAKHDDALAAKGCESTADPTHKGVNAI
jgi:hypothetical protein